MTISQLRRICKTWQKRLRITDWRINIQWGAEDDLKKDEDSCLGITLYNPEEMIASIWIDPNMDADGYHDGGIESTVIHELLHVVIHGGEFYKGDSVLLERAINQIADALYFAYRKRKANEKK